MNTELFPDMKAMTDYAHNLGLTAGWYGNNCICAETKTQDEKFYQGDVKALISYGFDGVKLDGCGSQLDLQLYDDLIKATGKAIMVENCHWGSAVPFEPTLDWCPWNFFRTSGDVRATYSSILENLETTYKYADTLLSRPGCWVRPLESRNNMQTKVSSGKLCAHTLFARCRPILTCSRWAATMDPEAILIRV